MSSSVRIKVLSGLDLAVTRVLESHRCHEPFTRLNADGVILLLEALYYPAKPFKEMSICRRAVAYTKMDGVQTWLCRDFSDLSDEQAAMTLIHEALHHAGLGEGHGELTSADITLMVKRECSLKGKPSVQPRIREMKLVPRGKEGCQVSQSDF